MAIYWKVKKLDYFSVALELKNRIPELKKIDCEIIADKLRGSNLEFYKTVEMETPFFIRLTLPFAVIFFLLLLIFMPINYFITGEWGYKIEWFKNWMNKLGF